MMFDSGHLWNSKNADKANWRRTPPGAPQNIDDFIFYSIDLALRYHADTHFDLPFDEHLRLSHSEYFNDQNENGWYVAF